MARQRRSIGAIAPSYPPRVRVRATVKLSATFFYNESSITKRGGIRKCNSPEISSVLSFLEYIYKKVT